MRARLADIEAKLMDEAKRQFAAPTSPDATAPREVEEGSEDDVSASELPSPGAEPASGRDAGETASSVGLYRPNTRILPGRVPVPMGGMAYVRPVEMPELVQLVKELTGKIPVLRRYRRALGRFYGGSMAIGLNPDIFQDPSAAAKTLAHEIGHLVDYLPTGTLKRGNLLGRLLTLNNFIKDSFGGVTVKAKEIRKELLRLTRYWKPYNPATDPPSYVKYRQSAKELYADALSVLLNSPGLLEKIAPKFYREFFTHLDRKPEVKAALIELQTLLAGGKLGVAAERAARLRAGFQQGEDIMKQAAEERAAKRRDWRGLWTELKQALFDANEPLHEKARALEKAGTPLPPARDPRLFMEEFDLAGNSTARLVDRIYRTVTLPVEAAGFTLDDLGEWMFLRRISGGDRAPMANPGGMTPEAARLGLLRLRLQWGMDRVTALEAANKAFHDLVYDLAAEATEVGAYNRKTFEETITPNRDTYAAFGVLDYLQDYVPAGIKQQIGTLKDIANPFITTALKAVAMQNLISVQRAKWGAVEFLSSNFPGEIERSAGRMVADGIHLPPSVERGKGVLTVLDNGRPAYFIVDEPVARMFEHQAPGALERAMTVLTYGFRRVFYPMWITYNAAWQVANVARDFSRTQRNIYAMTGRKVGVVDVAKAYQEMFSTAVRRLRQDPAARQRLIEQARANRALGIPQVLLDQEALAVFAVATPEASSPGGLVHRDDFVGDLLRRYRLLPEVRTTPDILKPAVAVLDAIAFVTNLTEALPKLAGYHVLRDLGVPVKGAAATVRNYVGTPNVHKRGLSINLVRPLVPFWNVFAQGMRSDAELFAGGKGAKTAGTWWMRWAMFDGAWTVFTALAAAGLLGMALKRLFENASDYDRTNYHVIPVGSVIGGDFGERTAYLRLPRDESSRLLSGILYKSILTAAQKDPGQLAQVFDFGAGQVPTVNPLLSLASKWGTYLGGNNPTDPFRGRPIIPRDNWTADKEAPGPNSIGPMVRWSYNQTGLQDFFKYDPTENSGIQVTINSLPVIHRFLKVSDYGQREMQRTEQLAEDATRAQHRLELPENVRSLMLEYGTLSRMGEHRTPVQESRYAMLGVWHAQVYRPIDDAIKQVEKSDRGAADGLRKSLGEASKSFARPR